ncbi:MAG: S-methyl-5-thioribose-1-phosphate isomerase [Melioribacteraceae bacterium]|nr:S-methyl-5-thioribose-1-phosphate isomerase [Melioribacteraceae bacterium]
MYSVELVEEKLKILDQTKLPFIEEYIFTDNVERIAQSIEKLEVRGAPAIGITAAYALALSIKNSPKEKYSNDFFCAYNRIKITRPTAVNLFYAIDKMKKCFDENHYNQNLYEILLNKAKEIHLNDIKLCELIAENGLSIFSKKSNVLTHCNTGFLATGGNGTALNVIRLAFENNLIEHVFVDETRPLLQGSRLTAWELEKLKIPFTIITDSTAAFLMQQNKIDLVITGADRITLNGDSANKIGTYNLAVLCNYHKIPFYLAAPFTTIDLNSSDKTKIKIEERNKNEIFEIGSNKITKQNYSAYNPAFDIIPNELITGIITDKKIFYKPFDFKNV